MQTLEIETTRRSELVEITSQVQEMVSAGGVAAGVCVLWSLHTTCGLTVNEAADPAVARDIETWLGERVPEDGPYRHREGNSDSHIKTSLVGPGLTLLVEDGRLVLGRWQGVFLCEFDGPRRRRVAVRVSSLPSPGSAAN